MFRNKFISILIVSTLFPLLAYSSALGQVSPAKVIEFALETPEKTLRVSGCTMAAPGNSGKISTGDFNEKGIPITWTLVTNTHVLFMTSGRYDPETRRIVMRFDEGSINIKGFGFKTEFQKKSHLAVFSDGTFSIKYRGKELMTCLEGELKKSATPDAFGSFGNVDNKVFWYDLDGK